MLILQRCLLTDDAFATRGADRLERSEPANIVVHGLHQVVAR